MKENPAKLVGLGWTIAANGSGVKRVIPNHFVTNTTHRIPWYKRLVTKGMHDMLYGSWRQMIHVSDSAKATSSGKPGYTSVGSTPHLTERHQ